MASIVGLKVALDWKNSKQVFYIYELWVEYFTCLREQRFVTLFKWVVVLGMFDQLKAFMLSLLSMMMIFSVMIFVGQPSHRNFKDMLLLILKYEGNIVTQHGLRNL